MAAAAVESIVRELRRGLRPLPLRGHVQPYAWGGFSYLRELTGLPLPGDAPAAEWWLGAHPSAPSTVSLGNTECALDHLIAAAPSLILGSRVVERFGPRLPYLLKVLDVRQMLSIQAHPTKQQAEEGFAREHAERVPLDAPLRNYRDDNHKPEAQVALTPFWMLVGFRPLDSMRSVLGARPELQVFADRLDARPSIKELYEHVMALPKSEADHIIGALWARLAPAYRAGLLAPSSPDFWAARAMTQFRDPDGGHDRGVVCIYLMNLVSLEPGDATFLGAGLIHAYLEGQCVEIMANSDNVLRGGLTSKHVDISELQHVVDFVPSRPAVQTGGTDTAEQCLSLPVAEFGLCRLALTAGHTVSCGSEAGPETVMVLEGAAHLEWSAGSMLLNRGGAALIPAGAKVSLLASNRATVFRAFVPITAQR